MQRRDFITGAVAAGFTPLLSRTGFHSKNQPRDLMPSNYDLYVEDFGAVPDWTTDSTTAIQSAINTCYQQGGGIVRCGVGGYKITSPLTVKNMTHLMGMGGMATYIRTLSNFPAIITATGAYNNISLSGFHVDMSANHTAASGIDFRRGLMRGYLHDIRVTTSPENTHGIIIRGENPDSLGTANQGQFNTKIDKVVVKPATNELHQGYGLYLYGAPIQDARVNNISVYGGEFEGGSGAICVEHGQGNNFYGVDVELSNAIVLRGASTWKIGLFGNWFDDENLHTHMQLHDGLDLTCYKAMSNTGLNDNY